MIVADPSAIAVRSPVGETVTTPVSDDDQSTVISAIALPPASAAFAMRVSVSPMTPSVTESRESVRVAGSWATVAVAVPVTEPDVAMIEALPLVTAVTSPEEETVATSGLEELQVTEMPVISVPLSSFTVAVS